MTKKKEKDEEDVNAALVRLKSKSSPEKVFFTRGRVVVDEMSRRVCELVVENVVEKEVVTSELLAALEGMSDGTEGRFLMQRYLRYMRIEQHERTKDVCITCLYRAMKSGAANVFSTVLYYATLKENDIERFEGCFID